MQTDLTVFIVNNDPGECEGLRILLNSGQYNVETFSTIQAFLDDYSKSRQGCLILDMGMDEEHIGELKKLKEQGVTLPIIILTGKATVPMAVSAMKGGASDFIEKPFQDQVILDAIESAMSVYARAQASNGHSEEIVKRLATMTPREQQVLDMVVGGMQNKEIAAALQLSHKTIEYHRSKIMEKIKARSVADLVRIVLTSGEQHKYQ